MTATSRPVIRRVDAHQHFWRYTPAGYPWIGAGMDAIARDFLPDHLEPLLRDAGFDACVAVQAQQTVDESRWLLDLADRHAFIAGVVGWVDLRADDVERDLERLARSPKLVGIRHLVQDDPDDRLLLDSRFCRGIARLAAFDLAYDILIYPRHLEVAATFVERFPEQRFVLDHVAKPAIRVREIDRWASDLAALAAHPNVFVKLSGLVTEADWKSWTAGDLTPCLDVAMELFGTDRLMIGSDWPVCLLAADYERTLAVVRDHVAPLPEAARRRILGETAAEVYGLTRDREVR